MSIRTTATCDAQIAAIDDWWRANRDKAPDLFLHELADTLRLHLRASWWGLRRP